MIRPQQSPLWILRGHDQRTVAVLLGLGITAVAGYWLAAGGISGRLIEIERQAPQPAAFGVDLNQAAWPELAQLPGIGETLARRIIDSRQHAGPFSTHDDLLRVSGIGPKKLAKMKPYFLPIEAEQKSSASAAEK